MPFGNVLIMAEGAPEFHEQRGLFVLTVPIGDKTIRIGFLPHDFMRGCVDGRAVYEQFLDRQQGVKRLRA